MAEWRGVCQQLCNNQGYNGNQGFCPNNKMFLLLKKRHVKKDYPIWKRIHEKEKIEAKPKVGVNVTMVD
jgi:hypothetical protein